MRRYFLGQSRVAVVTVMASDPGHNVRRRLVVRFFATPKTVVDLFTFKIRPAVDELVVREGSFLDIVILVFHILNVLDLLVLAGAGEVVSSTRGRRHVDLVRGTSIWLGF